MDDIGNVNNSIWVKVQTKKIENIKYLENIKTNGEKEKKIHKFIDQAIKIFEVEIERYLIKCEIILKYYLNKVGLLSDIMGIFQHSNDEYMFKIDYKQYLYNNFTNNFNNNINNNINSINANSNANNISNTYYSTKPELIKTCSTNETQLTFNQNNNNNLNCNDSYYYYKKNIENNLDILFMNSIKIILRQDKLNIKYLNKIKSYLNKNDKNINKPQNSKESKEISIKNKKSNISSFSFPNNNSVITSKSSMQKKKGKNMANTLINNTEGLSIEEILKNQLIEEKNNLKYRLMYLQYFILRYINVINDCYNTIYNNMDSWIIMNMDTQNNKLNEFINYLKRALNKNFDEITMKGREFDYNDKYVKNKKVVLPIYKNLYPDNIINLGKPFSKGDDFRNNLIKITDINLVQQYVYNINDLMNLYLTIKEYSLQTCEYYVKYEIVKELFMNYVINQKEYSLFYDDNNKNRLSNVNANINNISNKTYNNMNGVCKIMKFYSYGKIDDFIKIFCVYDNKYININELFTTLIIIGSELISVEKFDELIKEFIPEEKKNDTRILLKKEEFLKIHFWFENDRYLNELSDNSEEYIFIGDYSPNYSINQINIVKKKKYNDKFGSESKTSFKKEKIEKKKKIDRIKEVIFEMYMENNLIDIIKLKELIDKLNLFRDNKIKDSIMNYKEDTDNVDIDDKCYRFSMDNVDNNIEIDKNIDMNQRTRSMSTSISQKHVKVLPKNIFNIIFEK